MGTYKTGCLICGKPLKYGENSKSLKCEICGLNFESNVTCEDEHYICDSCHGHGGYIFIRGYCKNSKSKNPVEIACEIMADKSVHMHGPEHHFLVSAALIAAFKNSGGDIDIDKALNMAAQRAKNVPGGICGMWGSCGAAVSAGIFCSVITGATPLSKKEWSLSNLMTSKCLYNISQNGGPRCCKRNTWLALFTAIDFAMENFAVNMEKPEHVKCNFSHLNDTCIKGDCLYSACRH